VLLIAARKKDSDNAEEGWIAEKGVEKLDRERCGDPKAQSFNNHVGPHSEAARTYPECSGRGRKLTEIFRKIKPGKFP
jgi:hypothetical protein